MDPTFQIDTSEMRRSYINNGSPIQSSGVVCFPQSTSFARDPRFRMVLYPKSAISVAAVLAQCVTAQFVAAPTDLITKKGYADVNVRYKEVPHGICELDPNVKSYSGYADVSEHEHIFWYVTVLDAKKYPGQWANKLRWFFETRNGDPKDVRHITLSSTQSPNTNLGTTYSLDQWRPWLVLNDWFVPGTRTLWS